MHSQIGAFKPSAPKLGPPWNRYFAGVSLDRQALAICLASAAAPAFFDCIPA